MSSVAIFPQTISIPAFYEEFQALAQKVSFIEEKNAREVASLKAEIEEKDARIRVLEAAQSPENQLAQRRKLAAQELDDPKCQAIAVDSLIKSMKTNKFQYDKNVLASFGVMVGMFLEESDKRLNILNRLKTVEENIKNMPVGGNAGVDPEILSAAEKVNVLNPSNKKDHRILAILKEVAILRKRGTYHLNASTLGKILINKVHPFYAAKKGQNLSQVKSEIFPGLKGLGLGVVRSKDKRKSQLVIFKDIPETLQELLDEISTLPILTDTNLRIPVNAQKG